MNNDLAYFLGLWVAEGSFENNGRLTITCGDADVGDFLMSGAVEGMKFLPVRGRTDQWRISSSEFLEMMRFLKMPLVKAPMKFIPDWVWAGKREWAEHFISGMLDGDGYISSTVNKAGYTSSSQRLAKDFQLLLTNMGVIGRLSAIESLPTERVLVASMQYRVEMFGDNVSRLKDILHLRIERKRLLLEAMSSSLLSRRDGVPIYPHLKNLQDADRKKRQELTAALGMSKSGSVTTYRSIGRILEESLDLAEHESYKIIQKFYSDRYFWDDVTEVVDSEADTCDFTIPDTHSFWSNGFISHNTPKSFNQLYTVYAKGQDKRANATWESWQFPTITSPFIPKSEIEAARRDMDEKSFRQEFMASFETMAGRVYYPFDRTIHVGNYPFNPHLPIWIGQDFNIDPMSTVVMQPQPSGEVWIVDEIILFGSNTEETCQELEKRYWRYIKNATVYPDPAGGSRQHARGETDLDVFREKGFKKIKHRRKHPAVADRVNAVNRMLKAADGTVKIRVNSTCKFVIDGFEQTIYKKGSREVDKSAGVEHPMDALGYAIELEFPIRKVFVAGMSL